MTAIERVREAGAGAFAMPIERRRALSAARANEWLAIDHAREFQRDGIGIEIAEIVRRGEGVDIFARAWRGRDQIGFGRDGSIDLECFHFGNPPLLVPDRGGDVVRQIRDPFTGDHLLDQRYRVDIVEALQANLALTIRDVGKVGAPIKRDKRGRTTYTLFGSADGCVQSQSTTYANARSGAGDAILSTSSFLTIGQAKIGANYYAMETVLAWLTSSVTGTVSAATASVYLPSGSNFTATDYTANMRLRDWGGGTATTADWVAGASLSGNTLLATFATSGLSDDAYAAFTSQAAFISNINQAGETRVMVSSSRHEGDTAPTGDEYFVVNNKDESGTTTDPRLVIEASAGVTKHRLQDRLHRR